MIRVVRLLSLSLVLAALLTAGCSTGGGESQVVISAFTASPAVAEPGQSVALSVTASDTAGGALNYAYSVVSGGGAVSGSGATAAYTVPEDAAAGSTITLRVTVTSAAGESASREVTITVAGGGGDSNGGVVVARVRALNGLAVPGVTAALAGVTATGNEQGFVTFDGLSAVSGALLTLEAEGYMDNAKRVDVIEGETVTLDVTMAPVGARETVDVTSDAQVLHAGGGVILPGGGVVTAAGAPAASAVVSVTVVRASDEGFGSVFPGPFEGEPESGGEAGNLKSYGIVDVEITDASGAPLELAAGRTAEVLIPIDPATDPGTPTVPLWYFSKERGLWVEEGVLTRDAVGGVYRGSVSHFSTWNADCLYECAWKQVTVLDPEGQPVVGAYVVIDGPNWRETGYTNAQGVATIAIEPLATITVSAQKGTLVTEPRTEVAPSEGMTLLNTITLAAPKLSVVLTWGPNPSDLDSHITVPTPGVRSHVFYDAQGSLGASPWVALDTDDTSSYGPEIVSATRLLPGVYRYMVHNYSGQEGTTLAESGARVVLTAPGLSRTWTVPTNGGSSIENDYWRVFDLVVTESGQISLTEYNDFTTEANLHPAGTASVKEVLPAK